MIVPVIEPHAARQVRRVVYTKHQVERIEPCQVTVECVLEITLGPFLFVFVFQVQHPHLHFVRLGSARQQFLAGRQSHRNHFLVICRCLCFCFLLVLCVSSLIHSASLSLPFAAYLLLCCADSSRQTLCHFAVRSQLIHPQS